MRPAESIAIVTVQAPQVRNAVIGLYDPPRVGMMPNFALRFFAYTGTANELLQIQLI